MAAVADFVATGDKMTLSSPRLLLLLLLLVVAAAVRAVAVAVPFVSRIIGDGVIKFTATRLKVRDLGMGLAWRGCVVPSLPAGSAAVSTQCRVDVTGATPAPSALLWPVPTGCPGHRPVGQAQARGLHRLAVGDFR